MKALTNVKTSEETRIKQVLDQYPFIRLAILFGSLVCGNVHHDSDLDLALGADHPLDIHEKMEMIETLACDLGRPVDLVDIFSVGEPLLGQIVTHGKKILGANADYAFLVNKHLLNQADFMPYRTRILAERRRAWIGL